MKEEFEYWVLQYPGVDNDDKKFAIFDQLAGRFACPVKLEHAQRFDSEDDAKFAIARLPDDSFSVRRLLVTLEVF